MQKPDFQKSYEFITRKGKNMKIVNKDTLGLVLMFLGTFFFASKAIFIKLAYDAGANPEATLLFRQLIATPLFILILWFYRPKLSRSINKKDIVKASLCGLLGFFLSPLLDFLGLNSVSAVVERILIITYPIFVIIMSAFIQKKMISFGNLITIVIIYLGIFMIVGGWNVGLLQANLKGSLLIILSSFVYAIYFIMSGNLVHKLGSIRMNSYGMIVASFSMFLYLSYKKTTGYSLHLYGYSNKVYILFFLLAVISTVLSFVLITEGIKRIGVERAAIISMLGPVLTIILGGIFLKESLNLTQWCGSLIIFLSVSGLEIHKIRLKKKDLSS